MSFPEVNNNIFDFPYTEKEVVFPIPLELLALIIGHLIRLTTVVWDVTQSWVSRVKSSGLSPQPCGPPVLSI